MFRGQRTGFLLYIMHLKKCKYDEKVWFYYYLIQKACAVPAGLGSMTSDFHELG